MLRGVAAHYKQSMETPYKDLPGGFQARPALGLGRDGDRVHVLARRQDEQESRAPSRACIPNLQRLYQESESEFTRNRLKGFMSPQFCDACQGQRLKPEILAVRVGR